MIKNILSWAHKLLTFPLLLLVIPLALISFIKRIFSSPSQERDWSDDQKIIPNADIHGDMVTVYNIRNFSYRSVSDYTPGYYDMEYDIRTLKHVWYIVEPFGWVPGSAHTLVSFEFENDIFLAISVELRKKKGLTFYPTKSLVHNYELMYVIADENDVIKLRSNYRKDPVYLYKTKASKKQSQELFLSMITRANELYKKPEFFNTFTNNCTTNIIRHVNAISPNKISRYAVETVFPRESDRLAYNLGLLESDTAFEKIKERSQINEKALLYANDENFSRKIRGR